MMFHAYMMYDFIYRILLHRESWGRGQGSATSVLKAAGTDARLKRQKFAHIDQVTGGAGSGLES